MQDWRYAIVVAEYHGESENAGILGARQLSKPRGNHDHLWAAWQNLAEENFEAIKTAAEKL